MDFLSPLLVAVIIFLSIDTHSLAQSSLCRTSCGAIPIRYPLGIDDGCGSPYYRNMLICSNASRLFLRTPSGTYPVAAVDYTDPHLVVNDPSMWSCHSSGPDDAVLRRAASPFSLDTSTRFSLSSKNDYLFLNCEELSEITIALEIFSKQDSLLNEKRAHIRKTLPNCFYFSNGWN
ncbi:hypothetical protein MUK42_32638 [Musa troglodytarum]|uniref:Wall-associated receptor kinase galacturonan-binding domain-containing protein n=1 Tax=Musa troglodytarum TaxID=320322 RepID=A0A9E7KZQ6_9LILI|nr:hypothetical protein MUK42_32638 [Musa troglodytarum]